MGLLVNTTFETSHGIPITNVYLRITSVTVDFVGVARVTIKCEAHVNREKRLEGRQPLYVPNIPTYFNTDTPLDAGWNNIQYLYGKVKDHLTELGFQSTEDVFEPAPEPSPAPEETEVSPQSSESILTTLPTPPTPEESVPPEQQTEPQPQ